MSKGKQKVRHTLHQLRRKTAHFLRAFADPFIIILRPVLRPLRRPFIRYVLHPVIRVLWLTLHPVAVFFRRLAVRYHHLTLRHPFMRTLWFRSTALAMVALILFGPISLIISQVITNRTYTLDDTVAAIVGTSTVDTDLIKTTDTAFTYNRADEAAPSDIQKVLSIAAAKEDATGEKPYQAELSKDQRQGITFSDSDGSRTIKLIPQFITNSGRLDDEGRVLYPSGSGEKHIYSFKTNGIKSDLVLTEAPDEPTKTYTWDLQINSSLEARMLPTGGVGIYSADTSLYDNLQIGDDKSQALIDKARTNAEKNTLVFELPTPFIVDSSGLKKYDDVSYSLDGTTLTLEARNLQSQTYPLTIDPTITVTTTSDFRQNVGDTGNTDFGTDGEIQRSAGSLGGTSSWSATASFTSGRRDHTTVAYNGYLYVIGGYTGGSPQNDVQYAPINSNGTIGSWSSATSFTTTRYGHTSVVYNGYLYVMGGWNGSTYYSDVQYAPINSNGTVGSWTTTTSLTTARRSHAAVAYNGYAYVLGGWNGSTYYSDVNYAPLNADGTIGTWTATTSFTTARNDHTSLAYNGYLYVIGGTNGTKRNDVQYAPINSNGTLGTWNTTSSFTTARNDHTSVAYNGYLYVIGGDSGSNLNDVQYAPINANGTIGAWAVSANFTTARAYLTSAAYNGYVYVLGGWNGSSYYNDVQYAKIGVSGPIGSWTTTTSFTTGREGHGTVAYNGYLYIMGGYGGGSTQSDVQYAPINGDGTTGTWNTTTSLSAARYSPRSVAYNGYMYVIGGADSSLVNLNTVEYAPINSNGTLGSWSSTSSFTTARRLHATLAYNGYMYVIGGYAGGGGPYYSDVQYAVINGGGTLGSWSTTTAMSSARYGHTAVASNGYMYVIGGHNGSSRQSSVEYAPINGNGTIGSWTATTSLSAGRELHASAVYNGALYVVGGSLNTGLYQSDVLYANINADGSLATWNTTTSFSTGRYSHGSVIYNGYIYVVGGLGTPGSYRNDTQYAKIYEYTVGTLGENWNTTSSFTNARADPETAAYNGYIYLIGGTNGPSYYSDVQYAPLNADGTVGTWNSTTSFTNGRSGHAALAYNGYLYVIGGFVAGPSYYNDVQYAPINSNGTVGTWNTTTSFTTARYGHSSVAYNGYLYVIGGYDGSSWYNDVQYAAISSTGTVGSWTTTTSFTTTRYGHASIAYNGYLYVIGGRDNTVTYHNDVQYAAINYDGSVGTWSTTTSFASPRVGHNAVVYNGYVYVLGGKDASTYFSDVQYAPINANGTIGSWTSTSSFTTGRVNPISVAYDGYMYIMGGQTSSGYQGDVQYTPVKVRQGASNDSWTSATGFTNGRDDHASVAYNGYLYILGGRYGAGSQWYNDVQYAPINLDGSIGTWSSTTSFTTVRYNHTAVVYDGYMYIIGGRGAAYYNDVQYAPVNSNGTVGSWTATTSFTSTRYGHTSFAYNGYVYVIGGNNSGTYYNDVQYAPINSNGTVGSWTATTSFTTGRTNHTSVAYNGYVYILGGYNGTVLSDVQYVPINSNGTVGTWTATTSMPAIRYVHSSVVFNGYVYIIGGITSGFSESVQIAPIASNGTIGDWISTANLPARRDIHASVVYNGYLYVTGGNTYANLYNNHVLYTQLKSTAQKSRYERTFDTAAGGNSLDSFTINGAVNCAYTVEYRSAGSNAVYGSSTTVHDVYPGISQSLGLTNTRYIQLIATMDDSNCGGQSTITSITLAYNASPDAPTLFLPVDSAVAVSTLPEFRLGTTDDPDTFIQYSIEVCSTSNCSSIVRTIDQTSSQTGWISQSQNNATGYAGGATLTQVAVHQYQPTELSPSTQYWWRARAIDPNGTNNWGSYSAIDTFTTGVATPAHIKVQNNTTIYGGSTLTTGN